MTGAAMGHRTDGGDLGERLGERVAKLEGTVEQIDGKVNWLLGIASASFVGLVLVLAKMLLQKG